MCHNGSICHISMYIIALICVHYISQAICVESDVETWGGFKKFRNSESGVLPIDGEMFKDQKEQARQFLDSLIKEMSEHSNNHSINWKTYGVNYFKTVDFGMPKNKEGVEKKNGFTIGYEDETKKLIMPTKPMFDDGESKIIVTDDNAVAPKRTSGNEDEIKKWMQSKPSFDDGNSKYIIMSDNDAVAPNRNDAASDKDKKIHKPRKIFDTITTNQSEMPHRTAKQLRKEKKRKEKEKNTKESDMKVQKNIFSKREKDNTRTVPATVAMVFEAATNEPDKVSKPTTKSMALRDGENKKDASNKYDLNLNMNVLSPYSIAAQLTRLFCNSEETNVTIIKIGRSVEYNDIMLIQAKEIDDKDCKFRSERKKKKKVPKGDLFEEYTPDKKIILIVHGLAAMGFKDIPCLVKVKKFLLLIQNYFEHLDKFDIYVVPMANPDGVAYTYTQSLWNKNLTPQESCPGVALDRNFDVAWANKSNVTSCSQQYPGDRPFSEPETKAIRELFHKYSNRIVAYIHVHATGYHDEVFKGDAVLYPKGYSDNSGNDDKYVDLKGELDEVMKNASFNVMAVSVETLYDWYGKVTGSSVDYASTVYGIPYAMEFVMQIYEDHRQSPAFKTDTATAVQNEIWHRLIDAIFRYIYKKEINKAGTEDRRKQFFRRKGHIEDYY